MIRTCSSLLGLALVLAVAAPPTGVHAQPLVIAGSSLGFAWLTPTPTPRVSTARPSPEPTTVMPALRPFTASPVFIPATATPTAAPVEVPVTDAPTPVVTSAPVTETPAPATTAAPIDTSSSTGDAVATTTSTPPTVQPKPSSAAPVPSTKSYDCDAATTSLITKFYGNNVVLEGDCAVANNKYRFPFEGVPSRAQLNNMSKTAACTVLMQALLQLVPKECDFKRIPLRSTAEAILQLAKSVKKAGNAAVLPSEQGLTQAIEARRQSLLNSGSSKAVDGGPMTASTAKTDRSSATPTASGTTASSTSSGSDWIISDGITSVNDDGQHILMDANMLVVGTWSDNPDNSNGETRSTTPASSQSALLDTKIQSTSASDSLQLTALSLQVALVLAWVFVQ